MHQNPFTAGGYDYAELKRAIDGKASNYELASLQSNVDRLESSLREARSENDGLRSRIERLEEVVRELNPGAYL